MTVVLVDWLGRGGIAQCSDAWGQVAQAGGRQVVVVSRAGRELADTWPEARTAGASAPRLLAHGAVVRLATRTIRSLRPAVVVVANYLVPPVESSVLRAAQQVGARCVLVVHDHRLHARTAGVHAGLGRMARMADVVVVHSAYVGRAVAPLVGRTPVVHLPHPIPRWALHPEEPSASPPWAAGTGDGSLLALHYGVLHREYKGTDVVTDLARTGVPGWRFALLGVGAPADGGPGSVVVDRFVPTHELVAAVRASDVTLLPYRFATQSGAVVLAQALGSVVVSTRVGGIPEQVVDGRTGVLLDAAADLARWRAVLEDLRDERRRGALAAAARVQVAAAHQAFTDGVAAIVGIDRPVAEVAGPPVRP